VHIRNGVLSPTCKCPTSEQFNRMMVMCSTLPEWAQAWLDS
jgi:hypothetical protein